MTVRQVEVEVDAARGPSSERRTTDAGAPLPLALYKRSVAGISSALLAAGRRPSRYAVCRWGGLEGGSCSRLS